MQTRALLERISIDANILHGKPRIKGTRIAVSMILELLAEGVSAQEIRSKYYPDIAIEDIQACIAFANQFLSEEEIHFFEELSHTS